MFISFSKVSSHFLNKREKYLFTLSLRNFLLFFNIIFMKYVILKGISKEQQLDANLIKVLFLIIYFINSTSNLVKNVIIYFLYLYVIISIMILHLYLVIYIHSLHLRKTISCLLYFVLSNVNFFLNF